MRYLTLISMGFLAFSLSAKERDMTQPSSSTQAHATTQVTIHTTLGDITVELFPKIAPKACQNFIDLARKHYYDGVIFHRVIKGFMIQGGDPTGTGTGGQSSFGKSFEDECSPSIKFDGPGYLAMANRGPNTNGSQFFITTVPCPWLNNRHTIFGKVIGGMDTVSSIEKARVGPQDRPVEKISIKSIDVKS